MADASKSAPKTNEPATAANRKTRQFKGLQQGGDLCSSRTLKRTPTYQLIVAMFLGLMPFRKERWPWWSGI